MRRRPQHQSLTCANAGVTALLCSATWALALAATLLLAPPGLASSQVVVQGERLRIGDDAPQARLRYGALMVPGSERIETAKGKHRTFVRVERDPKPGEYSITPMGIITFNSRDRRARLVASYAYCPRTVAVLAPESGTAPPSIGKTIRQEVEKLFAYSGYRVVPSEEVDREAQARRIYATSEFTPELLRDIGAALAADEIVVLRVEDWETKSGKSLMGFLWTGPFGGSRKRVTIAIEARMYGIREGRMLWESRSRGERRGSILGGVRDDLKRATISDAVSDLFDSYFAP